MKRTRNTTINRTTSKKDDAYRRSLVTSIVTSAAGTAVESLNYAYDALNRPISRNADTFGYNDRSEVTSATIGGIASVYGYDEIGNSTNWTANSLNQYAPFTCGGDKPPQGKASVGTFGGWRCLAGGDVGWQD